MPTTVTQILDEFPEFRRMSAALLAAKLADAERLTALDYPVDLRDIRVKYLCLELLAMSPTAEFARLDPKKEPDGATSTYQRQRMAIDQACRAPMVI